jgi:cell wall-associated NlpC family hydrolase
MARPSKSEFEKWNPAGLAQQADALRSMMQTAQKDSDDAEGRGKALGEHIRGTFGSALGEQMGVNTKSLRAFSESLTGLAAAYTGGAQKLAPTVQGLQDVLRDAQSQGFTVTDDWKIQDTQRPNMHRAQAQEQLQPRLSSALTALDQADHETMSDIAKARQALYESPMPQLGLGQTPAPQQHPNPKEPEHEDPKQQDHSQPGASRDVGSEEKPGVTDVNDPNVKWKINPEEWKKSWHNPQVSDNPPGYTGGPGPERDAAWQQYLANYPKNGKGFLPNPDAVQDKGLKTVGAAAQQLGTSYAWAGGDTNGPSKGVLADKPDDSHVYGDNNRVGFDCSGLAEYAAHQATLSADGKGVDIGGYTGSQVGSPTMHTLPPGEAPKPGDMVYYGSGEAHHVGIYVAPGVIINAPGSGVPVELDQRSTTPGSGGEQIRVRRLN